MDVQLQYIFYQSDVYLDHQWKAYLVSDKYVKYMVNQLHQWYETEKVKC